MDNYNIFLVPYIFHSINIKGDMDNPMLVGSLKGEGVVKAIVFHTNCHNISVGYSADNQRISWINNGNCLQNMRAYGPNAGCLPVFLLEYKGANDLAIAVNTPLSFKSSFRLFFKDDNHTGYLHHLINSLHLYMYGMNIEAGEGNLLKF